jgi:hypothetical protein
MTSYISPTLKAFGQGVYDIVIDNENLEEIQVPPLFTAKFFYGVGLLTMLAGKMLGVRDFPPHTIAFFAMQEASATREFRHLLMSGVQDPGKVRVCFGNFLIFLEYFHIAMGHGSYALECTWEKLRGPPTKAYLAQMRLLAQSNQKSATQIKRLQGSARTIKEAVTDWCSEAEYARFLHMKEQTEKIEKRVNEKIQALEETMSRQIEQVEAPQALREWKEAEKRLNRAKEEFRVAKETRTAIRLERRDLMERYELARREQEELNARWQ